MQNKELTGKVFDIKGFSVHDGPGIRITVFLKGCPLRCPWCHSPESQAFHTELNWMEKKCIGIKNCGVCVEACPHSAILQNKSDSNRIQLITIDRSKCDNCGKCAKVCTAGALFMCGTDYTVDEVVERICRDVPFFNRSGGGVTISGGECLSQPEFVLELLKRCGQKRIHTAVDTSGFVKWEVIKSVLPYTDIFLYDIKGIDSSLHKQVIGTSNELILENVRKIAKAGGKLHIRIPVIPGYNDSVKAFEDIGKFIIELEDAVKVVQMLPYHKLGTVKWERLQRDKPKFETKPPSDELIQARKKQLEDMGLVVAVG